MTNAAETATNIVAKMTTLQIVDAFETCDDPTVRGWLMDELEARNPEAFDAWLEAYTDSPRRFFEAA